MDSIENHDWIENYTDYEAVIRCVNTLPPWDSDACLRGFQTFNWHDASTSNEELVFSHQNTGVIVRFDGAIVAIQFASKYELMHESFVDLFLVLNGFGWTQAVVYHPAKTMSALLKDMGAAIAAYMNLDIKPAVVKQSIETMDVANDFLEKGTAMRVAQDDEIIFNELNMSDLPNSVSEPANNAFEDQSLDDELDTPVTVVLRPVPPRRPDIEIDLVSVGENPLPVVSGAAMNTPSGNNVDAKLASANSLLERAGEMVQQLNTELTECKTKLSLAGRNLETLQIENQELVDGMTTANETAVLDQNYSSRIEVNLREAQSDYDALKKEHDALLGLQQATLTEKETLTQQLDKASKDYELMDENANTCKLELSDAVENGQVLLGEKNRLSAELVEAKANIFSLVNEKEKVSKKLADLQAKSGDTPQVVSIGESHFVFDFPETPFMQEDIENIRADCNVQDVTHFYIGASDQPLRWNVLGEGSAKHPWFIEKMVSGMGFDKQVAGDIPKLIVESRKQNGSVELREFLIANEKNYAVVSRLGSLLLCEPGDAFVDLKKVVDMEPVSHACFTVDELIASAKPILYVVHVDSLDSEFVHWLANLLRFVVVAHSRSSSSKGRVTLKVPTEMAVVEQITDVDGPRDDHRHPQSWGAAPIGPLVPTLAQLMPLNAAPATVGDPVQVTAEEGDHPATEDKKVVGEFMSEFGALVSRFVGRGAVN